MRLLTHLIAVAASAGLVLPLAGPSSAQAQGPLNQPVRIVVPYTAGGPADVLARNLGQQLSAKWGQPVIVDNRPGANEIIAAQEVARAPADGSTFLIASDAVFSPEPALVFEAALRAHGFRAGLTTGHRQPNAGGKVRTPGQQRARSG